MKRKQRTLVSALAVLAAIFLCSLGLGAKVRAASSKSNGNQQSSQKTTSNQNAPRQQAVQKSQPVQFNEDWTSIPASFKGDDIIALAKSLDIEKGEFENLATYHNRLNIIAERKEKYVFLVKLLSDSLDVQYDAELEQYEFFPYHGIGGADVTVHSINSRKNGMRCETDYGIHLSNESFYRDSNLIGGNTNYPPRYSPPSPLIDSFKISSSDARKYKNKFKVMLIVRLIPFYPMYGWKYANRYYDRGFDNIMDDLNGGAYILIRRRISVHLESVWLYNELDNKVIAKHVY
jgi:hypothetical protein